jgi:hypothetical protein
VILSRRQQPVNLPEIGGEYMQFANNLKLYRVTGFFISEFYLLASSQEKAEEEVKEALTKEALAIQVEECKFNDHEGF